MNFLRRHGWLLAILFSLAVMFCLGFIWAVMLLPDERLREYDATRPHAEGTPWPVWVTTGSKFYHYHGRRWYGRSLSGRYMTEQEAIAAGNVPAGN